MRWGELYAELLTPRKEIRLVLLSSCVVLEGGLICSTSFVISFPRTYGSFVSRWRPCCP